jgi:hypothetical protein
MSRDIIDEMLENKRKYESGDYEKKSNRAKVQPPDSISWLEDTPICPDVSVINISQDHWISCKRGPQPPIDKEDEYHTWTAISGSLPAYLNKGSVLIARRTNRNSDGSIGGEDSGVMGIWIFNRQERVKSNSDHPWDKLYAQYLTKPVS